MTAGMEVSVPEGAVWSSISMDIVVVDGSWIISVPVATVVD